MACKDRYRAAVVGLRGIGAGAVKETLSGNRRAAPHTHASAHSAHERVDLVAACDLDGSLLDKFRETWGEGPSLYDDLDAMLGAEDIDILSIATSDHTHADLGITAIEAGVPMVFCEKPMTTSLADADALVGAVEDAGTAFSVDHTRRWDPFFRQAYDFIQSGRIGRVVRVVGTWGGTRALEYRNGSHTVDAVNMYAGGSPQWVVGVHEPPGEWAEPAPSALVQYDNGVLAFINQTKSMPKFTEWQVFCEQGRVRIGGVHSTVEYAATTPSGQEDWLERQLPTQKVYRSAMLSSIDDLIRRHEGGPETFANVRTGLMAVEVIEAMRRSHDAGQAKVEFPLARGV
ncbi:MAG: Gfo/Idh/MocA family oxidoreductase [Chloroflexi bacterium]|nr:Gfo/Idh/MocA family oxidoreductase [Chloroflexota bacterium]